MRRLISLILAVSLTLTSFSGSIAAPFQTSSTDRFNPPRRLASITERYTGTRPQTVVLIQDLHLNYGVQRRIADLLAHWDQKRVLPPAIAVEGAEGVVDASLLTDYSDAAVRTEVADYFLRSGELPGPDAYAIQSGQPHLIQGVEKGSYYELNRQLFKKSFGARLRLTHRLNRLHTQLRSLAQLNVSRAAEVRDEVQLLERLLNQEVTEQEVGAIAGRLSTTFVLLKDLLQTDSIELAEMEEAVRSAIDYYALAITRERPIFENTVSLLKADAPIAVLVVGGFHTKGLTALLREHGYSYIVLTPRVNEISPTDQQVYRDRLLDKHLNLEQALSSLAPAVQAAATALEATGHWLLRHPVGQRLAIGVLYATIARRARRETPQASATEIAHIIELKLLNHPLVKLEPDVLKQVLERVVFAPRKEVRLAQDPRFPGWHGINQSEEDLRQRTRGAQLIRMARAVFSALGEQWQDWIEIGTHRTWNILSATGLVLPKLIPLHELSHADLFLKQLQPYANHTLVKLAFGTTEVTFLGSRAKSATQWSIRPTDMESAGRLGFLLSKMDPGEKLELREEVLAEHEELPIEARAAVAQYITGLKAGRQVPQELLDKLVSFHGKTQPSTTQGSLFELTELAGQPVWVTLDVPPDTSIRVDPVKVTADGDTGASISYFEFFTGNRPLGLFRVRPASPYLQRVDQMEHGLMLDFIDSMKSGLLLWRAARHIKQASWTLQGTAAGERTRLHFGDMDGMPVHVFLDVPPTTVFQIKGIDADPNAPKAGTLLEVRAGERTWLFYFSRSSPFLHLAREMFPPAGPASPVVEVPSPSETTSPGETTPRPSARTESPEKLTKRQLSKLIEEELTQLLLSKNLVPMATRYGLHIINLLWGMLGPRLNAQYDEKEFRRIFNRTLLRLIDEEVEAETKVIPVGMGPGDYGESGSPRTLDPHVPDQEDITVIGTQLGDSIKDMEHKSIVSKAQAEILRGKARTFLYKLESDYFFSHLYEETPGPFLLERAERVVETAIHQETVPVIQAALQDLLANIQEAAKLAVLLRENGLKVELNLYQLLAVAYHLRKQKSANGDDMGLGKTLEIIATFLLSGESDMFVLAPKEALKRFMQDLANHVDRKVEVVVLAEVAPHPDLQKNEKVTVKTFETPEERDAYLSEEFPRTKRDQYAKERKTRKPDPKRPLRMVLMNYQALPRFNRYQKAHNQPPIYVPFAALDEAHFLKEPSSQRTEAVFGDRRGEEEGIEATWIIPASGTFIENGLKDLLGVLKYMAKGEAGVAERMFGELSIDQLEDILRKADPATAALVNGYLAERMIRRRKDVIIRGLPKKIHHIVSLNMREGTMRIDDKPPVYLGRTYVEQYHLYDLALRYPDQFEREYGASSPRRGKAQAARKAGTTSRNRSALRNTRVEQVSVDPGIFGADAGSIKFDAARHLIQLAREEGQSTLIFTDYRKAGPGFQEEQGGALHFRDYLESSFDGPGTIGYIDGFVKDTEDDPARTRETQRFQDREVNELVATTPSMGYSAELTQAGVEIFLNGPWTDAKKRQAEDRAHRRDALRNYPGRELHIYDLFIDHPNSIDARKTRVRRIKGILSDMFVDARLDPELIETYYDLTQQEDNLLGPMMDPYEPDPYELSLIEKLQLKIGQILATKDAKRLRDLWEELAPLYAQLLEHKSSFFANRASLDYLSQRPEFRGRKLTFLDAGSGPSVALNAFRANRSMFDEREFAIQVTDYDISERMLRLGVSRDNNQVVGSLDKLGEAFGDGAFDIVNLSYSWRYAKHPAKLISTIKRILKKDGLMVLILPYADKIPEKFIDNLQAIGLTPLVGYDGKLKSDLSEEDKARLKELYGSEVAADLARQAKATFTFLVVKKTHAGIPVDLSDEDFRIVRHIPAVIDRAKIDRIQRDPGRLRIVPEDTLVEGEVEDKIRVESVEVYQTRFLYRAIKTTVQELSDAARSYEILSARTKGRNEAQLKRREADIHANVAKLKKLIDQPPFPLSQEKRTDLLRALEQLKGSRVTQQWVGVIKTIEETMTTLQSAGPTSPLTTDRTRAAIQRLYRMRGQTAPSEFEIGRIAASHEYRLSRNWNRFVGEHRPQSLGRRIGLWAGIAGIWLGTLALPVTLGTFAGAYSSDDFVMRAVAFSVAAISTWFLTQRQANIATHALINTLVLLLTPTFQNLKQKFYALRELRERIRALPQTLASHGIYAFSDSASELLQQKDAPSTQEMTAAMTRILAAA